MPTVMILFLFSLVLTPKNFPSLAMLALVLFLYRLDLGHCPISSSDCVASYQGSGIAQ